MKLKLSKLIVALGCLPLVLSMPGCLGMAVRALATDNASYEKVSSKLGSIHEGTSRVWVYIQGGGPNIMNTMGAVDTITFNERAYGFAGDAYFNLDLPAGHYTVTTTDTVGFFGGVRQGKIQKGLQFDAGNEYFLRVQYDPGFGAFKKPNAPFDLIERPEALVEMAKLKHDKDKHKHWRRVKISS